MSIRPLFINFFIVLAASTSVHAETATVITKENAIRESCRFFSPVKTTVHYNDALEVISREGDWLHVKFRGVEGCIHKSAIQKKSISLSNIVGSKKQSTSGEEVTLAGKGFNPQVEAAYKTKNPSLNFGAVDGIESYRIPESKLRDFILNGKLNLP
jgi:hypothetical protein